MFWKCPRRLCGADIFCAIEETERKKEENHMKDSNEKRPSGLALIPFAVFIVIYMGAGIYYQARGMDMAFYQFPSVTATLLDEVSCVCLGFFPYLCVKLI